MASVFKLTYNYKNDVDLIDSAIRIYAKTVLKKDLSDVEVVAMRWYIKEGYSKRVKELILLELSIKDTHLNTVNSNLQKKGLLNPHDRSQWLRVLSQDMENLKKVVMGDSVNKGFMIVFNKDDN